MHTGKNLSELAHELERRETLKKDFVVTTNQMYLGPDAQTVELASQPVATETTDHAHGQLATHTGIPKRYYDKMMASDPALVAMNVNHWLHKQNDTRRMVRTMDGTFRAFLSDRYRRIDNAQVAQAALEPMLEMADRQELRVLSADVTDRKLYIQAAFPRLEGEVKVNDVVQYGLIISNSEIGQGALDVRPILYRLVCNNGMVLPRDIEHPGMRRNHVGRRVESDEDYSIYADETLAADDRALMLKIRDTVRAMADQERFLAVIQQMQRAARDTIETDVDKAVDAAVEVLQLPESRKGSLLTKLIEGRDYSRWGLANAITAHAHDSAGYDDAVELEELGGRVITLSTDQWQRIATAA